MKRYATTCVFYLDSMHACRVTGEVGGYAYQSRRQIGKDNRVVKVQDGKNVLESPENIELCRDYQCGE